MRSWLPIASFALAMAPTVLLAQTKDPLDAAIAMMRKLCKTDYYAHCVGTDPAYPIEAACLSQFYTNLSPGCRAALDQYHAPQTPDAEGQFQRVTETLFPNRLRSDSATVHELRFC